MQLDELETAALVLDLREQIAELEAEVASLRNDLYASQNTELLSSFDLGNEAYS